jgi:DnaD/phage-associated family protein
MSIFRVEKKENYVVLDKGFLNDKRLSWQAKGLLAYMLSLPNDWVFNINDLKNRSRNGRDATKNIIKELQEFGYIIKEQTREKGKFSNNRYIVLEHPALPLTENPLTENPSTESPLTENPSLLNNKELNNDLLSNKENLDVVVVNAHHFYEQNFGPMSPFIAECITKWVEDTSDEIVIEAMKRALKQQKKWNYAEGILQDWAQNNLRTIEDIEAYEREFHRKREEVNNREVHKHRRGVSRSTKEGKSYEQILREAEAARKAWGWRE